MRTTATRKALKQLEHAADNLAAAPDTLSPESQAHRVVCALRNSLIYGSTFAPQLQAVVENYIKSMKDAESDQTPAKNDNQYDGGIPRTFRCI